MVGGPVWAIAATAAATALPASWDLVRRAGFLEVLRLCVLGGILLTVLLGVVSMLGGLLPAAIRAPGITFANAVIT